MFWGRQNSLILQGFWGTRRYGEAPLDKQSVWVYNREESIVARFRALTGGYHDGTGTFLGYQGGLENDRLDGLGVAVEVRTHTAARAIRALPAAFAGGRGHGHALPP